MSSSTGSGKRLAERLDIAERFCMAYHLFNGEEGHSWRCVTRKNGKEIHRCVCGYDALENAYEVWVEDGPYGTY